MSSYTDCQECGSGNRFACRCVKARRKNLISSLYSTAERLRGTEHEQIRGLLMDAADEISKVKGF